MQKGKLVHHNKLPNSETLMVIVDLRDVGKPLLLVVHYPCFLTKLLDSERVQEHMESGRTVDDLINYGIMLPLIPLTNLVFSSSLHQQI
jgi:hypothetical protein